MAKCTEKCKMRKNQEMTIKNSLKRYVKEPRKIGAPFLPVQERYYDNEYDIHTSYDIQLS